jgi:AAA15 family ATPase/GTPase
MNRGDWLSLGIKSVLIPSAEMLSHSKGLVAMSSKYGVPFDQTQMDILVNAQLWETKEISERNKLLLDKLGAAIDGEVIYENDTFYIVKSNGLKVEYSLEADGFKRIGLLWKLIRNGLLESGSILLWDEPESSVHPEFMYLIAEVLHILAQDGVQIFIATHSYAFAKYLDIMKKNDVDVLFVSLYKEDGIVKSTTANSYSSLQNNAIEASEEKLYEAVVEDALEDM